MGQKGIQDVQSREEKNNGKLGITAKTCAGRKAVRIGSGKGLVYNTQDKSLRWTPESLRNIRV